MKSTFVLFALLLVACGNGDGEESPRRAILIDLANHVIAPTYGDLAKAAVALERAAAQLDSVPSAENLAETRQAWRATRSLWKRSQAFNFGPAETLRTAAKIDWSPIREQRVESAIAAGAALTSVYVDDLGANQKGFLALEYLLFDADGNDDIVLEHLADADGRRRRFVLALCENLADQTQALYDAWRPEVGGFVHELGEAGRGSVTYPTIKSGLDDLINGMIFLAENIADSQLLQAIGRGDGPPDPASIVTRRSGNGRRDVVDNLYSIRNTFLAMYPGKAPHSMSRLVGLVNADAEAAIRGAIVDAIVMASQLPDPLQVAVVENREEVAALQSRVSEVMRRLEIDLITILGGTLRFNPNDGD